MLRISLHVLVWFQNAMSVLRVFLLNCASNEEHNSYLYRSSIMLVSWIILMWNPWQTGATVTLFRIGKRMRLQASRRTMRCVYALWERLFFLRKDFNYHTNRTNRRSPMIWSRLPCKRSHCKQVKWKWKSEKNIGTKIISDLKTNVITSFEKNNAMNNALWARFFFSRKDFTYANDPIDNRRSPMIWVKAAMQAFKL